MSITVVGSVAFDTVTTPFGKRERMLGGAATHFALAASFFADVHVVGTVGEDFGEAELAQLATRGTDVTDVERVAGGRTFFWEGNYGWDLNSRETLDTQPNVFEHFQPRLSAAPRACDVLFLANIQPALQLDVLDQCDGPNFTALDSMNLWIDVARDELLEVVRRVDCVVLNDAELRQLTAKPNLVSAAREVLSWGPSAVVAKQGEFGAALVTSDGFFALPAYPLEDVIDPTGAGDTFAGGFVGAIASQAGRPPSEAALRRAMAYGTAVASFNVEEFGADRVGRLTRKEIDDRVTGLHAVTQFEHVEAVVR